MRVAHYLIRGQSGLFYFRLRIPSDLRHEIGRTVIKQAIGTRCPRAALAVAVALSSAYARSFKELRRGDAMTKPTDVDDLLKNLSGGNIHEWKGSVVLPNGAKFENVEIASKAQADWFGKNIEDIGRLPPHLFAAVNALRLRRPQPLPRLPSRQSQAALPCWRAFVSGCCPFGERTSKKRRELRKKQRRRGSSNGSRARLARWLCRSVWKASRGPIVLSGLFSYRAAA